MGYKIRRIVLRDTKKTAGLNWLVVFFALPMVSPSAQLSKSDSGWVPLFNGENFEGLYSRMYGEPVSDQPNSVFQVQTESGTGDPMIHVAPGGGHIGTDAEFSHYRMRVQYRFGDNTASNDNAGLMYHITEDWPRMSNNWPRSIECQMRKQETGDAFSIQDVTYEIPVRPGTNQYEPGSSTTTTSWSGNHRQVYSLSHVGQNPYDDREWNTMEIIVRGADSAEHTVDGVSLLKLYDIRIPNPNGGNGEVPWSSGKLALQAEGAEIMYKNWEIMELPENGPDYLHRLIITSPTGDEELNSGDSFDIEWNTIGDVENVNIEISGDGENWESIAEDIENTGSYSWTIPSMEMTNGKIRVSAEDYVTPGLSEGNFSIALSNAKRPSSNYRLDFYDAGLFLESEEIPETVEFFNAAGHLIHKFNPREKKESLYLKRILNRQQWGIIFIIFKSEKFEKQFPFFWKP